MKINFKLMREGAKLPAFSTEGAAAADLFACIEDPVVIQPGGFAAIPTGLAIELPGPQYVALILPRSGLGVKHGITLRNTVGVIDSDYRGEMQVTLINGGSEPFTIEKDFRIAQLLITSAFQFEAVSKAELSDTARGQGGFGSTGIK